MMLTGPMNGPSRITRAGLASPARAAIGTTLAGSALSALSKAPAQVAGLFHRRFPTVAVTGMTGVGKTQLADRLSRHTPAPGTQEVGSAVMERRTRRSAQGRGFRFRVVPGDNAATRLGALDDVFHDEPVDGILHVVAYGHATPRRAAGITGSAVATPEAQREAELEDWAITAHRIAAMAVRRDKPVWLIICVTKADLFPDQVEDAVRYYSPGSGTPFGDKVDELRALAGGARLSIDVLPVCSIGGPKGSPMSEKRCSELLTAVENRMSQLSGHH